MSGNLSKHVVSEKPIVEMRLGIVLHGMQHRLFEEGDKFSVGGILIEMLADEKFRVTYTDGRTELFKLHKENILDKSTINQAGDRVSRFMNAMRDLGMGAIHEGEPVVIEESGWKFWVDDDYHLMADLGDGPTIDLGKYQHKMMPPRNVCILCKRPY